MKKLLFLSSALIVSLLLSSCGSSDDNGNGPQFGRPGGFGGGPAASVEVVPVQTETISDQVRSYGTIRAQDVVSITPQVSNRVTKILVDLGDNVSRGQVMAEIYDVPFRDAVQQARAQIRQQEVAFERDSTEFARQQQLYERNLISQAELDNSRATYLNSQASLEAARANLTQSVENLENTKIKSPVDGVVLSRSIAEGDVASSGQVAFEVANLVGFETRVFLPLQDWELIQPGQAVSLSLSSRSDEIAQGVVSRISPQLDATTGLGEVVITLTETTSSIYQGALVQARVNLQTRENVVVIPRSAMVEKVDTYIEPETGTIELERTYSAFISQGDSIAVQRQLELGIQQGDRIEILSGLQPGDGLIVTGHRNLNDGQRIRVAGATQQSRPQQVQPNSSDTTDFSSLSPEERRERLQNMSPEEREAMRERMQQSRGQSGNRQQSSNSN
ncbi:efflux RND transporter periplasmic adaptor subunit [Rhodohalobacter halophilus]|uniref:efflux RND transporter periplasmic adaptor subunit n=1 Tax=Rhodohalobacter halophilus TaxID=1812810 RepID=UPI00083F8D2C|nr:efflux RND transporter periplasmic adaptor subunit [Rhodohalobacter halophilus]